MLVLSRAKDERIIIGDNISVLVIEIRGDKVRLGIDAPKEVTVHREEVYKAIKADVAQDKPRKGLAHKPHPEDVLYPGREDHKEQATENADAEMYASGDHKQVYFPGSKQEG